MEKRYLLTAGYWEVVGKGNDDFIGRYDTLDELYAQISRLDGFYTIGIWSKDWVRIIDLENGGFENILVDEGCINEDLPC